MAGLLPLALSVDDDVCIGPSEEQLLAQSIQIT